MITKFIPIIAFMALSISLFSCQDVLESDLSKENIIVIAPSDSARSEDDEAQTFKWDELRDDDEIDLTGYNLQIVTPSFDAAERLILDSTITGSNYTISLEAGTYQWRVRGENDNTETPYVTRTLFVDSNTVLTGVPIQIISPEKDASFIMKTDQLLIDYSWLSLPGADSYELIISRTNNDNSVTPFPASIEGSTFRQLTIDKVPGLVKWTIIAKNSKNNTSTSIQSSFTVDTIPLISNP